MYNNVENFKKNIKYDNGQKGKELVKEILEEKENIFHGQEELGKIREELIEYINTLIKKIDKCQNDIIIKKREVQNLSNKN